MSALEQQSLEIITRISDALPQATELALATVRMHGIQQLIIGVSCLSVSLVVLYFALKNIRSAGGISYASPYGDFPIFALVFSFGLLTVSSAKLLSIWTWVALIQPELYMTKQILDTLL